jgi:hypothetical protein
LWWLVRVPSINRVGWAEQKSLKVVQIVPSATPTMTQTPDPNATVAPTQEPSAGWTAGTALVVKDEVSFVWVRTTPASNAPIRATLNHGGRVVVRDANSNKNDGVQWWVLVTVPSLNTFGWIEQKSLQVAPAQPTVAPTTAPSGTAATWKVPNVVQVRPEAVFVWLRSAANSGAPVLDTVQLAGLLVIRGNNPTWDGTQWWWLVQSPYSGVVGWVEQKSVDLVQFKTQTPAPTPTAASSVSFVLLYPSLPEVKRGNSTTFPPATLHSKHTVFCRFDRRIEANRER